MIVHYTKTNSSKLRDIWDKYKSTYNFYFKSNGSISTAVCRPKVRCKTYENAYLLTASMYSQTSLAIICCNCIHIILKNVYFMLRYYAWLMFNLIFILIAVELCSKLFQLYTKSRKDELDIESMIFFLLEYIISRC